MASFTKLSPRSQVKNPIIFTVYVSALLTSGFFVEAWLFPKVSSSHASAHFTFLVALWLWFTVLFANFAESFAEGRGRAQAATLRKSRKEIKAKKLFDGQNSDKFKLINSVDLEKDDIVLVEAGDFIPSDGEVIKGIASVNESAITGESAPVIRESGGDRSSVIGGTQVLSDSLVIRITAGSGETFIDKMIELVEGSTRQKTPNEIALTILLAALTIIFLLVAVTLLPFSIYSMGSTGQGAVISLTVLVALFVCLAPTTIGGLLSAIGISGMDRMIQANVIALSGQAVEAAGDIDVVILDKTGTITLGNRQATEFFPAEGVTTEALADCAQLSSLADETPEGRSIVILAKEKYGLRGRDITELGASFVPFTAQTRMSGADLPYRKIRKGSPSAVKKYIEGQGGNVSQRILDQVEALAQKGSTPLLVAENNKVLGVIELKDIIKGGIHERFANLRKMGIRTIMVTGDNPSTAAVIAAEAGVDDFHAEADPESKLKLIRSLQKQGHLVAMTGDGTNDAPALAQADVAVAMNTGTQSAKEAGNLIDLDSNPTKLIEIVEIGKQLLITRGALTSFSIANDVAKYFAILPAAFVGTYPELSALNFMNLSTPETSILSTVILNAITIIFLIPLAVKGVAYKSLSASTLLRNNVLIYGLGGLITPFMGIKIIDIFLSKLHFV